MTRNILPAARPSVVDPTRAADELTTADLGRQLAHLELVVLEHARLDNSAQYADARGRYAAHTERVAQLRRELPDLVAARAITRSTVAFREALVHAEYGGAA